MVIFTAFFRGITYTEADNLDQKDTIKYVIPAMVTYYAQKDGVNQKLAHYIAKHESEYDPNDTGDLDIICHQKGSPNKGKPVYARGVYQLPCIVIFRPHLNYFDMKIFINNRFINIKYNYLGSITLSENLLTIHLQCVPN